MPQGRPSMPQGRPSMPQNRPSMPQNRPAMPQTRPAGPQNRPAIPGGGQIGNKPANPGRPVVGARPNPLPGQLPNRPSPQLPGGVNRPAPPVGGVGRPTNRPAPLPGQIGDRPNLPGGGNGAGGNRPQPLPGIVAPSRPGGIGGGATTRPAPLPGQIGNRPGIGDRPGAGNLPGVGNRPGVNDRPGIGDRPGVQRPVPLPGEIGNRPNRPGLGNGGDRPVVGQRPWPGDRPGVGNRPGLGDWQGGRPGPIVINPGPNGRPGNNGNWGNGNWGNGNNINWGNNVNIGGGNWGWGGGGGGWNNYWQNNVINNHYHNWYHGSWNGGWANRWYAPLAVAGLTGWGMYSLGSTWGYGPTYVNPYYVAQPAAVVYDYSQPINPVSYTVLPSSAGATSYSAAVDPAAASPPDPTPEQQAGFSAMDAAVEAFKAGDYEAAVQNCNLAIAQLKSDPVAHELRALALCAMGSYREAAAVLNPLLAGSPGMNWTTVSGLYPNVEKYTTQLRALETFVTKNPDDAAAHFVLAYHYLIAGHEDAAAAQFAEVVRLQPQDTVAARWLSVLTPPAAPQPAVGSQPAAGAPQGRSAPPAGGDAIPPASTTATDDGADATPEAAPLTLTGDWVATAGDSQITLSLTDEGKFKWQVKAPNRPETGIEGTAGATGPLLSLDGGDQGVMVGKITPVSETSFRFQLVGQPPTDEGLLFTKQ
jgi:hypothetical protein